MVLESGSIDGAADAVKDGWCMMEKEMDKDSRPCGCAVTSVVARFLNDDIHIAAKPELLRLFAGRLYACEDSKLAALGKEILDGMDGGLR